MSAEYVTVSRRPAAFAYVLCGGRKHTRTAMRLWTTTVVTFMLLASLFALTVQADDESKSKVPSSPPPNIFSLSGAVHLIVAANSIGSYTVDSSSEILGGALLMFEPVSPYILSPMPNTRSHMVEWRSNPMTKLAALWFGNQSHHACSAILKQSHIFPVINNTVAVHHHAGREAGHVCVSLDGIHYTPTHITYEVLPITVNNFVHSLSSQSIQDINLDVKNDDTFDARVGFELAIARRTNGTVVLNVTHDTYSILNNTSTKTSDGTANLMQVGSSLRYMRLSETPSCMQAQSTLLERDIEIVSSPSHASGKGEAFADTTQYSFQIMESSTRYINYSEYMSVARNYHVCVSVTRHVADSQSAGTSAAAPEFNSDYDDFNHYRSSGSANPALHEAIMRGRFYTASQSLGMDGSPVNLYTVVPTLNAYEIPSFMEVSH